MATKPKQLDMLKSLPKDLLAKVGTQLANLNLGEQARVRVLPNGTPVPDEWVVSLLPQSSADASSIINSLIKNPGGFHHIEVFPYGIVNPEIGRIDLRVLK